MQTIESKEKAWLKKKKGRGEVGEKTVTVTFVLLRLHPQPQRF